MCQGSCRVVGAWGRLELRRNRSLTLRLHHRIAIGPTLADDTAEYLCYRLANVGAAKREIFSTDAVALIHEAASGLLRNVDRLATNCLKAAARGKHRIVDRELILHVLDSAQPLGTDEKNLNRRAPSSDHRDGHPIACVPRAHRG